MDRVLVYTAELPRSADFLQAQKNALYGLGYLAQAVLGSGTVVSGLACAPTSPASLQVQIGAGAIYTQASVDATAFSTLGTDGNTITKQGLSPTVQTLTITPPTTSGYSQIYLVEACYTDVDTGASVLPYYNAANPAAPYSGPANAGISQNTARQGICTLTLKAGAAATTGTQLAPTVDSGYVPLWLIGVANGQTTITSANISRHPNCPLAIAVSGPSLQQHVYVYAADMGAANAYAAVYSPAVTALTDGLTLEFKAAHANTGASTFSPNGLAALPIYGETHQPLIGGEIVVNGFIQLEYNSSLNSGAGAWVLLQNTGGASHGVTAAPGTSNLQLATTAFVASTANAAQSMFKNYLLLTASTTLTASQAGSYVRTYSTGAITVTLPLSSAMGSGFNWYLIHNTSGASISLAVQGSDFFFFGYTGTSTGPIVLQPGDTLEVINMSGYAGWDLIGGTALQQVVASFGVTAAAGNNSQQLATTAFVSALVGGTTTASSSLATIGYQKLPSGLIVQWGFQSFSAGGAQTLTITLPISFPISGLQCWATDVGSGCYPYGAAPSGTSQIVVYVPGYYVNSLGAIASNGSGTFRWYAIGH